MRPERSGKRLFFTLLLWGSFSLLPATGRPGAAAGEIVYSIQVAATQDRAAADKKIGELKKLGYNAFQRLETIPGKGRWYRVYVEKFASKADAEKEAKTLKSLGLLSDYSVKALPEEEGSPGPGESGGKPAPSQGKTPGTVEARPPERKGKKTEPAVHYLHTGSFKEKENAEKAAQGLVRHGRQAFFVEEGLADDRWFRVYVGEFASEQDARRAGVELKAQGLIPYFKPVSPGRGAPSGQKNPQANSLPQAK